MRSAFTLLEILVVIGIIALATSIIVFRYDVLTPAFKELTPDKFVEKAYKEASQYVWQKKKPIYLCNFEAPASLALFDANGVELNRWTVDSKKDSQFQFRFFLNPNDGNEVISSNGLQEIHSIEFHPSGCLTPAFIEVISKNKNVFYRLDSFGGGIENLLRNE